jgi:hypothetical protein
MPQGLGIGRRRSARSPPRRIDKTTESPSQSPSGPLVVTTLISHPGVMGVRKRLRVLCSEGPLEDLKPHYGVRR